MMKKVSWVLLCILGLFALVGFLIPSVQKNNIFVGNTIQNLVSSVMTPQNWIKWDSAVADAWKKNPSACRFREDTAARLSRINIPGKEITITQVNYLLYQVELIQPDQHAEFLFSIVPFVGNGQARSFHNAELNYAQDSRWIYKMWPSLKPRSFADMTMTGLKHYLDSPALYYGLPIRFTEPTDTIFLTQQETIAGSNNIYSRLPVLFSQLDSFARAHHTEPQGARNIGFEFLPGDSTRIMAGIHIPRIIDGDYLVQCKQFSGHQLLLAGTYTGSFAGRRAAYSGMEKYINDHQLLTTSLHYEKYLSPLPTADGSPVKIELIYPIRQ